MARDANCGRLHCVSSDLEHAANCTADGDPSTIIASGALLSVDVINEGQWDIAGDAVVGAFLAFVSAYLALSFMMRLLTRISFTPYVIYRVVLGAILLGIAYL